MKFTPAMTNYSLLDLARYASILLVPLFILYLAYYSLFHPLRRYPGPLLAKVTDAYGAYLAGRKILHHETYENFKKYGDVYRHGPDKLLFNSTAAVQDIFLNPRVAKGDAYNHATFATKYRHIVNCTDRVDHRRKRKLIGAVLNERSMRIFEPIMSKRINRFLKKLQQQDSDITNMSHVCKYLAMDVTGDLAFGFPMETQSDPKYRFINDMFLDWAWRFYIMMQMPAIKQLMRLSVLFNLRSALKLGKAIKGMVAVRMLQEKNSVHDFYAVASEEIEVGDSFFKNEMWPEAVSFLMAGSATTSSTLSAMFFYLSRYPECYSRLAKEIRTNFSSAEEMVSGSKLNGCKYLRACINETLRISPPASGVLWRQQDPLDNSGKPFVVDGNVIPRGTQVGICVYATLHDERVFPDPFLFNPDRWLISGDGDTSSVSSIGGTEAMRRSFVPFALGDRSCAGKAMAYSQVSITMARTMWYFDFERVQGEKGRLGEVMQGKNPEFFFKECIIPEHKGPNLVFKSRADPIKELENLDD